MNRLLQWFRPSSLARLLLVPGRYPSAAPKRPPRYYPELQSLEDRVVPSFYRPAVTNYQTGGFNQLQVWSTGNDGNLYNRYYDGTWHWANHGTGGAPLEDGPAVTVYDDPVSGTHQLQVWAVGTNGHLYNHYYDGAWHWYDFGTDGASLIGIPAVTVYDDPVSGTHQLQVWASGTNGDLYNLYYTGTWHWADHGTDGAALTDLAVGVYDDPASGTHQLQVWAVGVDGNLYNHYYDGAWHWTNFGTDGAALDAPAVTPYYDPASGEYQLQVWANGADGHLYNLWYDGLGNWSWNDFGTDGAALSDPAVTPYYDPASGEYQLQVWAAGGDGHLYNLYYDGLGNFNWADHSNDGAGLSDPAVTSYSDPISGDYQLQVWVNGNDGHLYNRYYDGGGNWSWSDHGSPGGGYSPGADGGNSRGGHSVSTELALVNAVETGSVSSSGAAHSKATDLVFIAHSRAGRAVESLGWLEAAEVNQLADPVNAV
jgi:hypothetical protein